MPLRKASCKHSTYNGIIANIMTLRVEAEGILKVIWGFDRFRPLQREAVRSVVAGRDVLVVASTAAGKSLCYQAPILADAGMCLVITPTISLIDDQVAKLRSRGVAAEKAHSNSSPGVQDCLRATFLYTTPERLLNREFLSMLAQCPIAYVAVDEAHCVSMWGHDFRPAYLSIARQVDRLGRHVGRRIPRIAVTATAPDAMRDDIIKQLGLRHPEVHVSTLWRDNLAFRVAHTNDKETRLSQELSKDCGGKTLVYCGTTRAVDRLHGHYAERSVRYHGKMDPSDRVNAQQVFSEPNGTADICFATNAFGLGVDIENLRRVIHLDLPGSIEAYFQEAGRAGRDGRKATALLLYGGGSAERKALAWFSQSKCPDVEDLRCFFDALCAAADSSGNLSRAELEAEIKGGKSSYLAHLVNQGIVAMNSQSVALLTGNREAIDPAPLLERAKLEHQNTERAIAYGDLSDGCRLTYLVGCLHGTDDSDGAGCGICDLCLDRHLDLWSGRKRDGTLLRALARLDSPQGVASPPRKSDGVAASLYEDIETRWHLTAKGRSVLRSLQYDAVFDRLSDTKVFRQRPPPDAAALLRLRRMRRALAKDLRTPESNLISERQLHALASVQPRDGATLARMGLSQEALDLAGKQILSVFTDPFQAGLMEAEGIA